MDNQSPFIFLLLKTGKQTNGSWSAEGPGSVGWPAPWAVATGLCISDYHCLLTHMWLFLLLDVFRKNVELTKHSGMKALAVCSHSQLWLISLMRFEGNYVSQCFIYKMGTVAPHDLPGDFLSHLNEREDISKQMNQWEHMCVYIISFSHSENIFVIQNNEFHHGTFIQIYLVNRSW